MNNPLQPFSGIKSISTQSVCPDKAASFWVDMVCKHLVRLDCKIEKSSALFKGTINQRSVAHIGISQIASDAQRVVRSSHHLTQADSDYFFLNIQRAGNSILAQDGREARLKPGDLALYSSSRGYEMIFNSAFEQTVLIIPADLLRACGMNFDSLTATTLTGDSPMAKWLTLMVDSCFQTPFENLPKKAQAHSANGLTEVMIATLYAFISEENHRKISLSVFHINRIKQFVIAHLRDPDLSVCMTSKFLGISTGHIHRMFAKEQITFTSWMWGRRLISVKLALENQGNSHRSISELAYDCGFNNMSHFSKVFRMNFNMTPHEWRIKARGLHQRCTEKHAQHRQLPYLGISGDNRVGERRLNIG